MGFRGEALSTITSVSKVHVISKFEDEGIGNQILFNDKGQSDVKSAAKEQGTTVRVENLFYNIPARRKYLKSASTEYRKIYELLNRYFIVFPNISFKIQKDGKEVLSLTALKNCKAGDICKERIEEIYGQEELVEIKYEGNGIKIKGYSSIVNSYSLYTFVKSDLPSPTISPASKEFSFSNKIRKVSIIVLFPAFVSPKKAITNLFQTVLFNASSKLSFASFTFKSIADNKFSWNFLN